ncbi:cupin-like domain-containing protein [Rhodanobacter sp. MP1X3]|uniref:cupin-like domain-containing protein n=1 Tax=Rhodanobacter sp. MP1X3 TaxID=2723086 RepID=UPI00160EF35C|nr:cupin-like domain-containing protein [Rhodanobacter sp. MP1X3]MBB6243706.1 hypothetical protein [Rhodanobacter sp. MP1X3]
MDVNKVIRVIDLVPGSVCELPRIEACKLTPDVFWNEYVRKHRPVIIKGGVSDWPAVTKWSESGYLENIPSSERTRLSRTFNPVPPQVIRHAMHDCGIPEGLREMRSAPDDATYSMPSIPVPKEWRKDLGDYPFLPSGRAKWPRNYPRQRLFIYRNASTEWHYHTMDETLTTQLSGAKRISLIKLDASNWSSYRTIIESNLHHVSCASRFFPTNAQPKKYEGIIEQGDVAYIPPFWWHGVDPNDSMLGATLAFCFRSPIERVGKWRDPATMTMLSTGLRNMPRNVIRASTIAYSSVVRMAKGISWDE